MTTGARRAAPARQIDAWDDGVSDVADYEASQDAVTEDLPWVEPPEVPVRESRWPVYALVAVAVIWAGVAVAGIALALSGRVASLPVLVSWVSVACGPLALIGIAYLLFRRTPRREAHRFGAAVTTVMGEASRLEGVLATLNARIEAHNGAIAAQAAALTEIGERTGTRLETIGTRLREGTTMLSHHAGLLDDAAERARTDLGVFLGDLPEAEARANALAAAIRSADAEAQAGAKQIAIALDTVSARSRDAQQAGAAGAEAVAAAAQRIEAAGRASEERVTTTTARISEAIDFTLRQAAEALEQTRAGIGEQGAAMLAMVDQSHAALGRAGAEAARQLAERIGELTVQLDSFGERLAAQDDQNSSTLGRLTRQLADLETRYIVLGQSGAAKAGVLDEGLTRLRGEVEQLANAMAAGDLAVGATMKRAEALRERLEACVDGIDIRLPDALERIEARAVQSHRVVDEALPKVEALLGAADAAAEKLRAADALVGRQSEALDSYLTRLENSVTAASANTVALTEAIADVEGRTRDLSEGAAARLVDTMLRVRETAMQAAQRAEEAIAAIVPKAAATLGDASRSAIEAAVSTGLEAQIDRIGSASVRVVETMDQSNATLLRQMTAMLETTKAIETRLEEGRKRLAKNDGDSFGRRMALLIEALRSTAIDVTAVLAAEVSDSAWEAYLKGDRSVFARRAVKVIDAGDAKQITKLYEEDYAFRDQVNHYIHDFEAMLRDVLANRDGTPLGVTLLSSDAGKLYVALAQGIERLRG